VVLRSGFLKKTEIDYFDRAMLLLEPFPKDMGVSSCFVVNVRDLARLWCRFPDEELSDMIEEAVKAVSDADILKYWSESKQQQCLVVWVEALYQLCALVPRADYHKYSAEAVIRAEDAGLGLSPFESLT
jgi:hypothetical protein